MASPLIIAPFFLYLALIKYLMIILPNTVSASEFPTSLPGCPNKCGDITIPYPFGTLPGCYRDGFYLTCNNTFAPPKTFLGTNIEVVDINITSAEVRVLNYIDYDCYNKTDNVNSTNLWFNISSEKAFLFSSKRNKFTATGCYTLAYISSGRGDNSYKSGCMSYCDTLESTTGNGASCNGLGCCQTAIPEGLSNYQVEWGFNTSQAWSFNPCSYAMLVQEDWYQFTVKDLVGFEFYERNKNNVPVVLDWAIRENGTCINKVESSSEPACLSKHSVCNNTINGEGYICKCMPGYKGNPYLPNGCTDINECEFKDIDVCKDRGTCSNTEGSYNCILINLAILLA